VIFPLFGCVGAFWPKTISDRFREIFYILLTGIELLFVLAFYPLVMSQSILQGFIPNIMGIGLFLKLDGLRYLFILLASGIWFLTTIYSVKYLERKKGRYFAFSFLTLSSTIGLFLSENLLNLFTFFEIMSITSYMLVIHDETDEAYEAGKLYIGMAVGGGMVLLMGLALLYHYTGTLNIGEIQNRLSSLGNIKYLIGALMLIGFGVKSYMFPLHIWVPKVYTTSSIPAGALLSGVLLKTGIFGILITTAILMKGDFIFSTVVLVLGLLNMLIGGFLAFFQRNLKTILAYSGMSQAGYILVGIGLIGLLLDSTEAVYGTLFHILNHAAFKVLLFMTAGLIYIMTGEFNIYRLNGWGKNKIFVKITALIGMFAMAGLPGHNGYISKTLLHESLIQAHAFYSDKFFFLLEIAFVIGSAFTSAYLLKIFMAIFTGGKEPSKQLGANRYRKCMIFPVISLVFAVLLIGTVPKTLFVLMAEASKVLNVHPLFSYSFYTVSHLKTAVIPILLGIAIYILAVRKYRCMDTKANGAEFSGSWINLEKHVYSPILKTLYVLGLNVFYYIDQILVRVVLGIKHVLLYLYRLGNYICTYTVFLWNRIVQRMFKISVQTQSPSANRAEHQSVFDIITDGSAELSSITYSVFIFAFVLAMVFIVSFGKM